MLNSSATLFSKGIYQTCFQPQATDRNLVRSGQIFSVVLALGSMIVATMIDSEGSLYNYLQKINATFFGPMLAVFLLGMLTTHVSALAAKVGMILGPILFYLLVFVGGDRVQEWVKTSFSLQEDLHFLHFLALVFCMTVMVMLAISRFRSATRKDVSEKADPVDMEPWIWTRHVAIGISVLTVALYVMLAQ